MAKRLKEGGSPAAVARHLLHRTVLAPVPLRWGSRLAHLAGGWMLLGMPGLVRDPKMQQHISYYAPWMFAVGSTIGRMAASSEHRSSAIGGTVNLREFVLNADAARRAEYHLVRKFAEYPKAVLRHFGNDPIRLAQFYAFIHSMRRVPPTSMSGREMYRIGNNEPPGIFKEMVVHALMYRLKQLPQAPKRNKKIMSSVLNQHKIKLKPMTRQQVEERKLPDKYPQHLAALVPTVVERARPDTVDEAISLALFEAAVARAKIDEHRLVGRIKIPKVVEDH